MSGKWLAEPVRTAVKRPAGSAASDRAGAGDAASREPAGRAPRAATRMGGGATRVARGRPFMGTPGRQASVDSRDRM